MALYGFQSVLQMNLLTSEHPMTKKLKKESELLDYLHTLYFKVIETNPGERFIRVADSTRRLAKKPESESTETITLGLEGLKLESHKDIAKAFALSRNTIAMNRNLARFEQLPIIDHGGAKEIEEKSIHRSGKLGA